MHKDLATISPTSPPDDIATEGHKLVDVRQVLKLDRDGLTQQEIAAAVGVHQSTVSRYLNAYIPTTTRARMRLRGSAEALAQKLIDAGDPRVAHKTLVSLGVLEPAEAAGVQVSIGAAAELPLPGEILVHDAKTGGAPVSHNTDSRIVDNE